MMNMAPRTPITVFIVPALIMLTIFVVALINAIWPRKMWEMFEKHKSYREPTNAYFFARRITSIVVAVIIALIALMPSIMYWLNK